MFSIPETKFNAHEGTSPTENDYVLKQKSRTAKVVIATMLMMYYWRGDRNCTTDFIFRSVRNDFPVSESERLSLCSTRYIIYLAEISRSLRFLIPHMFDYYIVWVSREHKRSKNPFCCDRDQSPDHPVKGSYSVCQPNVFLIPGSLTVAYASKNNQQH